MTIEIANRLCAYRKFHDLSQEELAERLEISRQAVSNWERAESSPDTENLILLSKIYGVTLDELLYQDPQTNPPDEIIQPLPADGEVIQPLTAEQATSKYQIRDWYIPFSVICLVAYVVLGVLFSPGGWGWGLLVFLLIPLCYTLCEAIAERDPSAFCFPVLVLLIYLILGITVHWWHPGWLLFLSVPVYYSICDLFKGNYAAQS